MDIVTFLGGGGVLTVLVMLIRLSAQYGESKKTLDTVEATVGTSASKLDALVASIGQIKQDHALAAQRIDALEARFADHVQSYGRDLSEIRRLASVVSRLDVEDRRSGHDRRGDANGPGDAG